MSEIKIAECVPYQLCPKCEGKGSIRILLIRYRNGTIFDTVPCDMCNGTMKIPMHFLAPVIQMNTNEPHRA